MKTKDMQYIWHLLCESTKHQTEKPQKIRLHLFIILLFGHMFSSTSHLISSLARHLGKNLLVCLIHPCSVQLWCLGIQHPLHPGGTFGPVDDGQNPSISRLIKTPQWGWGKGSKGQEKETSFLNRCQTSLWLHGNGGMPHCSMWSHILRRGLISHPSPFSGTSLWCRSSKISHLCRSSLFHTRSVQRVPRLLYIIWSFDWKNPNTGACFLDVNPMWFTFTFSRRFNPKRLTNEDNRSNQNLQKSNNMQVLW